MLRTSLANLVPLERSGVHRKLRRIPADRDVDVGFPDCRGASPGPESGRDGGVLATIVRGSRIRRSSVRTVRSRMSLTTNLTSAVAAQFARYPRVRRGWSRL